MTGAVSVHTDPWPVVEGRCEGCFWSVDRYVGPLDCVLAVVIAPWDDFCLIVRWVLPYGAGRGLEARVD